MENVLRKFIERKRNLLVPINGDNDYKYKIYNEISLQHELGNFLEDEGYEVFYEKNMYKCQQEDAKKKDEKDDWVKKEADIVAIDRKTSRKYAIELKFAQSKNGQIPEEMYQFVKDICFMEQVLEKKKEYTATFNLIIVNDRKYFSLDYHKRDKYYGIFRNDKEEVKIAKSLENGVYSRPTGKESGREFCLNKSYDEKWEHIFNNCKEYENYRYLLISHYSKSKTQK